MLGIEGKLIVREGPGGGSSAIVIDFELVGGLVGLRARAVLLSLRLDLSLSIEGLSSNRRDKICFESLKI